MSEKNKISKDTIEHTLQEINDLQENKGKNKLVKYLLVIILATLLFGFFINIPDQLSKLNNKSKNKRGIQIKTLMQMKAKQNIAIPKIGGEIPLGENVKHQWKSSKSRFVIVTEDNTKVYTSPSFEAEVIKKLRISERVKISFVNPEIIQHNDKKGRWSFIMNEHGTTPLGWVLDYALGYQNRFRKVTEEWYFNSFALRKGEYFAAYTVSQKGNFKTKWRASGSGIHLKGATKGRIYQYGDIIWAKKENPDGFFDIFYLDSDGKMHLEWKYKDSPFAIED
jgi:hypothetical protein